MTTAEVVDAERGRAFPPQVPLQPGESRGTDYRALIQKARELRAMVREAAHHLTVTNYLAARTVVMLEMLGVHLDMEPRGPTGRDGFSREGK